MKFFKCYGPWRRLTRWTNCNGTGGWLWGYWGIHIWCLPWLIRYLDKRDNISQHS